MDIFKFCSRKLIIELSDLDSITNLFIVYTFLVDIEKRNEIAWNILFYIGLLDK